MFGVGMVAALNSPLQTLVDVAWLFRDLGRESEFSAAVLDPDPIKGPWNDAARAVGDGDLARAADILETIGHTAAAAYARLRAAEAFATAGRQTGGRSAARRGGILLPEGRRRRFREPLWSPRQRVGRYSESFVAPLTWDCCRALFRTRTGDPLLTMEVLYQLS